MVVAGRISDGDRDRESGSLLLDPSMVPADSYHFAYIIYFTLGAGFLLPWNAFITAVDYFTYLYPDVSVDRIFAVSYMVVCLLCLLVIVAYAHRSDAFVRINVGLALFVVSLIVVPILDAFYVKGRPGHYLGFYITVAATALAGVADALMQGGLIGAAGELPERYMQAVVAGTAASGVLVSILRVVTKAIYPQDPHGLRRSANVYFSVSIVFMGICIILYNISQKLPVMKYYRDMRTKAREEEREVKGEISGSLWRSILWNVVKRIKWYGLGITIIYVVTLSIFPGYITEDVHSAALKDWYAIVLIAGYNVFDLIGKSLTAIFILGSAKVAVGACFARLLFYPLFFGCLHGPRFLRTESPVMILTCLLGLTNGYLTSVLMIWGPKAVRLQHAEAAGIVIVLFLIVGLAAGSILAWFWVI